MAAFGRTVVGSYAFLTRAYQLFCIQRLVVDFVYKFEAGAHADSTAAFAIVPGHGLGKLRHIGVHWLWTREHVKDGRVKLHKVDGQEESAVLMTTHLGKVEVAKCLEEFKTSK